MKYTKYNIINNDKLYIISNSYSEIDLLFS
jgi:hypothetical protein